MMPWALGDGEMPWTMVRQPSAQLEVMPAFFYGELLFYCMTLFAAYHSYYLSSRTNVFVFLGALIAGTANDVFFMALPIVNNFWQGQALIMLTPRLPLYIPCVYICFMYYPTVAARRLVHYLDYAQNRKAGRQGRGPLGLLTLAAVAGLLAMVFYWPYDIIGAKFLWWTWHDTDCPIAERVLGAPASSTLWTLTFVGCFAVLVDGCLERRRGGSQGRYRGGPSSFEEESLFDLLLDVPRTLWPVPLVCTPLMMVHMTLLQLLEPSGAPGFMALTLGIAAYGCVALYGIFSLGVFDNPPRPVRHDQAARRHLVTAVALYAAGLVAIALTFDPSEQKSTGVHQLTGECGVEATDITGNIRHLYLCVSNFTEEYDFHCVPPREIPGNGEEWYTVCGTPHEDFPRFLFGVTLRAAMAVFLHALCMWW